MVFLVKDGKVEVIVIILFSPQYIHTIWVGKPYKLTDSDFPFTITTDGEEDVLAWNSKRNAFFYHIIGSNRYRVVRDFIVNEQTYAANRRCGIFHSRRYSTTSKKTREDALNRVYHID